MKVKSITENNDGSANVEIEDITEEEQRLLIEKGFTQLLKEYLESMENDNE
ncbi:MAG: hypothetical protein ACOCRK_09865 [bacterium]